LINLTRNGVVAQNNSTSKTNQVKHLQYFLFFLTTLIIIQACGGGPPENANFRGNQAGQQNPATSVETFTAQTSDISQQIKSFGNIRAEEIVEVTPQVSNRVTQIYADLGDSVKQGEVLAKIYDAQYRDQFQQAKASLEQSRSSYVRDSLEFQRQQKLYEKDLISATEYGNAKATFQNSKAQFQSSKASLTESRENLENTKITSPVDGVVLTRNISEGDVASTGQIAYEIANTIGYQARVYLPLEEWRNVEVGQPVKFRVSNQPDISGRGRVTQISPRLDPTTGLGEVVISLTQDGQSIYQGVLVESIINVETHENAVVIPRAALVENVQTLIEPESNTIQLERSYSAFVVQGDSLAMQNELKLGIEQGDKVEVLQGIQPGDQVVITGQSGLSDSAKVRVAGQSDFQQSPEVPIENASSSSGSSQDTSSTS
jgi:RND family efflux transporter MFP subunit